MDLMMNLMRIVANGFRDIVLYELSRLKDEIFFFFK